MSRSSESGARRRAVAIAAVAAFAAAPSAGAALCADGSTFPAGGFVVGQPPVTLPSNWTPNVLTSPLGSYFVPDLSTFEHNDPAQPLTGGGHNWVFDQGSTLCKVGDLGPAGGTATSWFLPPVTSPDCILLPVLNNGVITFTGDVPAYGDVITPTCDPTKLSQPGAPNAANTYANQLGCSISHGVATTPQSATSFLFVAGVKGGLFRIALVDVANPVVGGEAGKVVAGPVGLQNYYSAIPPSQKLTSAAVSKDGQFAIATSNQKLQTVFACLNPLGDPGDPRLPIDPAFGVPVAGSVPCMQVGNNALQVDLTDAFGPDGQPYLAGQPGVNSFGLDPGGSASAAWPQCIWKNNGSLSLADAFAHKRQNGCGNAQPDAAFSAAGAAQAGGLAAHGRYMYAGTPAGTVVQLKVTTDPVSGQSRYVSRTYLSGIGLTTGIGVADDLQSLIAYSSPIVQPGFVIPDFGFVTRVPLCEDL